MQYLLLIYDQESQRGKLKEAEQGKMMQEYGELTKSIQQSGHYVASSQLHPVSKATTVRVRDGRNWSPMDLSRRPRNSSAAFI